MRINYSSLDTIDEYSNIFRQFCSSEIDFMALHKNRKLIDLTAGLGLSNSIHERYIKSILNEYMEIHDLSNRVFTRLVKNYKAPQKIKDFALLLNIDLEEGFNLYKNEINTKYPLIDNKENLLLLITDQRYLRNNYMHGDFNFNDIIEYNIFKQFVLEFQDQHNYVLKIFKYSFNKYLDSLPDLSNTD
jgi:hypothetical protein